MSTLASAPIVCAGCKRKFAWKPELAGKRVKCKCGQGISVPGVAGAVPAPAAAAVSRKPAPVKGVAPARIADPDGVGLDSLYALAEDAERAAAALPVEVREVAPAPAAAAAPARKASASNIPLAYQRRPSALQQQKASASVFIDKKRDLVVPQILLAVGMILYIGFYGVRFHLGTGGLTSVAVGLTIITTVKTAMLIGGAFLLAGPLGVGFGDLKSAILKLAAIAVFTDGVIAWVDYGVSLASGGFGGGGIAGFGIIGWPVSVGIYMVLMIYLFSMEAGDAWLVVICLGVASQLIRMLIMMFLLQAVLSLGGVSGNAAAAAGFGAGGKPAQVSAITTRVDDLKTGDFLVEARKYLGEGHQASLNAFVNGWYAAGCPNVWFEMSGRDINGHRSEVGLIVELPKNGLQRAKCYDLLKQYFAEQKMFYDPADLKDTGENFMEVPLQWRP